MHSRANRSTAQLSPGQDDGPIQLFSPAQPSHSANSLSQDNPVKPGPGQPSPAQHTTNTATTKHSPGQPVITCVTSPYTPSSSSTRSTATERRGTQNTENSCCAAGLAHTQGGGGARHNTGRGKGGVIINLVYVLAGWDRDIISHMTHRNWLCTYRQHTRFDRCHSSTIQQTHRHYQHTVLLLLSAGPAVWTSECPLHCSCWATHEYVRQLCRMLLSTAEVLHRCYMRALLMRSAAQVLRWCYMAAHLAALLCFICHAMSCAFSSVARAR